MADQFVGTSSGCISLCTYKGQTSQLCQYLKLAIEQKFSVQGIKTTTTNGTVPAEIAAKNAEAVEKPTEVRNDTKVANTQNENVSTTVVVKTSTVANNVDVILSSIDANSDAANEVNDNTGSKNNLDDNTGSKNNLDETEISNTEMPEENVNLPEDVKLDVPQENVKEEENKVDETVDSIVESPGAEIEEESNVNPDDETDNYEDSNDDVVNFDSVAGSHGLPYGSKGNIFTFVINLQNTKSKFCLQLSTLTK